MLLRCSVPLEFKKKKKHTFFFTLLYDHLLFNMSNIPFYS